MTEYSLIVHKDAPGKPLVSLILLDWECRERFCALDWLSRQDVPREQYELIWIELHDRIVPEVMEKADVVITCGQKGLYHKHLGYNIGLLRARGQVVTICDSDAVFPPDFVGSIIRSFNLQAVGEPRSLVLMHYQRRTATEYPDGLTDIEQLRNYKWLDLWPNVGACMSIRGSDAIRFGGFDEHRSLRGYYCGPYELGWRLVNAGMPEVWHDETVTLWHFFHPKPPCEFNQAFSLKLWKEIAHPHIKHHALTAVGAFSTGRLLPLKENPEIHGLRMAARIIGTEFEREYAEMTGPSGFTMRRMLTLRLALHVEAFNKMIWAPLTWPYRKPFFRFMAESLKRLKRAIGERKYDRLRGAWRRARGQRTEDRRQMTDDRGRTADDRGRTADDRGQRTDGR